VVVVVPGLVVEVLDLVVDVLVWVWVTEWPFASMVIGGIIMLAIVQVLPPSAVVSCEATMPVPMARVLPNLLSAEDRMTVVSR
jgi:hypothetical protein